MLNFHLPFACGHSAPGSHVDILPITALKVQDLSSSLGTITSFKKIFSSLLIKVSHCQKKSLKNETTNILPTICPNFRKLKNFRFAYRAFSETIFKMFH